MTIKIQQEETLRMPTVATLPREEDRDLGFGSVVAGESRQRLLNQDGSFDVQRTGLPFLSSLNLYHTVISMLWNDASPLFGLIAEDLRKTDAEILILLSATDEFLRRSSTRARLTKRRRSNSTANSKASTTRLPKANSFRLTSKNSPGSRKI